LIANHGQLEKNRHTIVGRNSRMDGIQAAILSIKLKHLDGWLDARRATAAVYDRLLNGRVPIPTAPDHSRHTYHLHVTRVPNRDAVMAKLREAGIETSVHYPTAIPFMEAYTYLGYQPNEFPVAFAQMGELLSLPMYAELTEEMIEYVCEHLIAATSRSTAA
jgi:dTDP-4-amino-4,6-dideoxygalactose transaminase